MQELWSAKDEDGNECELSKDDSGVYLGFSNGMYFSGYPSIHLDRKHLKDLFQAIDAELNAFGDGSSG